MSVVNTISLSLMLRHFLSARPRPGHSRQRPSSYDNPGYPTTDPASRHRHYYDGSIRIPRPSEPQPPQPPQPPRPQPPPQAAYNPAYETPPESWVPQAHSSPPAPVSTRAILLPAWLVSCSVKIKVISQSGSDKQKNQLTLNILYQNLALF